MTDLISRDYVMSALGIFNDRENGNEHFLNGIETAREIVENAPTIDAEPVVRCEYCYAYRKDKELARAANLDEDQYCALLQCEMPPNGYCYYGNKKEDIRGKTVGDKA